MYKKLLSVLVLTILVTLTLIGCSGVSATDSALTVLSITEGEVFVMKAGTDDWTEATVEMSLRVGDTIKTGDDSGAEIVFFDGSTIELEAGTQIEITALGSSPDTGTRTITLVQTMGTTISRVTKLLDPASTYAIETPSGVAAVRGSIMIVRIVFDDPDYEDGTVLMTNVEGHIYYIGQGEELQLPEGAQVIATNETAQLVQLSLAVDDRVATDEDTPLTVAAPGVLGNDSSLIVGDTLVVTALDTTGTVGNVTAWGADGAFTYDPNGQFEGLEAGNSTTDSFTYTVTDDYGISDTATVTISINGVYDEGPYTPPPYTPPAYYPPPYYPPLNHPPVAVDDTATTSQNTSITIRVLDNDHDVDGHTLAVDSVGPAGNGSVANNGNDVTYTPSANFAGTDSFDYTISDGNGSTDTATVTVTVEASVVEAPATLNIQIDTNAHAPIYVRDTATGQWVINGDEETPAIIEVAGGSSYSVWLTGNVTYYVKHIVPPGSGWQITSDGQSAYGDAAAGASYNIHFTVQPPS